MKKTSDSSTAKIRHNDRNRKGTILVIFMVSLAMLSLTAAAMVRVTLLQRSMVRNNELRIQSEWLFQSAVARASSELKSNAEYDGEEWKMTAESLGQTSDAVAKILVEPVDGKTNQRRVAITVLYPPDNTERATVSRSVTISL
jgi:flagellar basal body-associated protein FliL